MALEPHEEAMLELVIEETHEHCPPTGARMKQLSTEPGAMKTLLSLSLKGYLSQPYRDGPWIPVKDSSDNALALRLLKEDAATQGETHPSLSSIQMRRHDPW